MNNEIIFIINESNEGGYEAKALDHPIFTEADSIDELKTIIKDAIRCHFDFNVMTRVGEDGKKAHRHKGT